MTPNSPVFLNSAGASIPTPETVQAVIDHLHLESQVGGYLAADRVASTLIQSRADLGALVGGSGSEVALTASDSAGWVKAWWGWVLGGNVPFGSVVLADQLSYHSHYAALRQTQAFGGFTVSIIPSLPDGTVDLDALADLVDERVSAMSITMVGTHSGNVNPVGAVGTVAQAAGVPMFVDGCQAFAQLPVDVRELGCAVFTGTGRKWLRAPRGTGMLWVAAELAERFQPPGVDSNTSTWTEEDGLRVSEGMAKFEDFEFCVAAHVGMATAARQACDLGTARIGAEVLSLANHLRAELRERNGVTVHDTAQRVCGIATFSVAGVEPEAVVAAAAAHGATINSTGANWATLDLTAKGLQQVVRVSPHIFNTVDDIDRVVEAVDSLLTR